MNQKIDFRDLIANIRIVLGNFGRASYYSSLSCSNSETRVVSIGEKSYFDRNSTLDRESLAGDLGDANRDNKRKRNNDCQRTGGGTREKYSRP